MWPPSSSPTRNGRGGHIARSVASIDSSAADATQLSLGLTTTPRRNSVGGGVVARTGDAVVNPLAQSRGKGVVATMAASAAAAAGAAMAAAGLSTSGSSGFDHPTGV